MRETPGKIGTQKRHPQASSRLAREQFFMRVKAETHRTTLLLLCRTHNLPGCLLVCSDSDGLDCVTTTLSVSGVYC
jgi:hypothetical protein